MGASLLKRFEFGGAYSLSLNRRIPILEDIYNVVDNLD
jgi:hypothetical protein